MSSFEVQLGFFVFFSRAWIQPKCTCGSGCWENPVAYASFFMNVPEDTVATAVSKDFMLKYSLCITVHSTCTCLNMTFA